MFKLVPLIVFTISLYAHNNYQKRLDLKVEYRMVNACIDKYSFGGVFKSTRDKCIEKVQKLVNVKSEYEIKQLDRRGELEDYF